MTKFQTNKEPPELPDERIDDEISQLEIQFKQLIDSLSQAARAEEALVQDAVDVICTMDENGNFTEINNACFKQWGYLKEEIVGRSFELVVSRDDVPNVRKQLERLKDKSAFISFETGIERIDSSRMDASWSCFLSAESKSIFCFIRDISELNNMTETLKSRAEQVRSMMENIPVGVLVVDDKGIVKSANHEIESLIGCESGAVIQTSIAGLIERPTDGSSIATLKKADGERIPTEVTEIPLVMVGKLENLVVVDDIRERIRFENMKKDFVALLRENLRTPLLKVQEMVGTEDSTAETKQSNQIKRITSNTDRLLRLIEELLTIETFSPGKLIGELKPVPTAEILNTAVEALADYAAKQGVSIRVEPLESEVLGDRDRLIQVVINLLSNAIKFSPAKSEVVLKATPKNNTIEFSITDSGRGVPAELEEAIFKPYTQTSASDSEKGTGLGLPICKAIIDSHNGSIGVESASGGGSKFWFRIPGVL